MFAIRQIIEDPQDVIAIPPELRHRRTEVIFIAIDQEEVEASTMSQTKSLASTDTTKIPRANWFDGYQTENDVDVLESLPIDEATEEWHW